MRGVSPVAVVAELLLLVFSRVSPCYRRLSFPARRRSATAGKEPTVISIATVAMVLNSGVNRDAADAISDQFW